jgi:hypothetical protein
VNWCNSAVLLALFIFIQKTAVKDSLFIPVTCGCFGVHLSFSKTKVFHIQRSLGITGYGSLHSSVLQFLLFIFSVILSDLKSIISGKVLVFFSLSTVSYSKRIKDLAERYFSKQCILS